MDGEVPARPGQRPVRPRASPDLLPVRNGAPGRGLRRGDAIGRAGGSGGFELARIVGPLRTLSDLRRSRTKGGNRRSRRPHGGNSPRGTHSSEGLAPTPGSGAPSRDEPPGTSGTLRPRSTAACRCSTTSRGATRSAPIRSPDIMESGGEPRKALGVRERELDEITRKGRLHRACLIKIERCRLLALLGELMTTDLDAARDSARLLPPPRTGIWNVSIDSTSPGEQRRSRSRAGMRDRSIEPIASLVFRMNGFVSGEVEPEDREGSERRLPARSGRRLAGRTD